jgi:hypothetical protein
LPEWNAPAAFFNCRRYGVIVSEDAAFSPKSCLKNRFLRALLGSEPVG